MNYTLIIILIVLLFVIYQLRTHEKKEGFVVNNSVSSSCPSGYLKQGTGTSATCKDYTDISRCPSGYNYGTINSSSSKYCVKPEDDYKLCPTNFVYETSTGKCRKAQTYSNCPTGTSALTGWGNENKCRKIGTNTLQPTCPTGKINPKDGADTIITDKCCPSDKPWYQNKTSGLLPERGLACRANKL